MKYNVGDVINEYGVYFSVEVWTVTEVLKKVTLSIDYGEFDGSPSMWAYMLASKGGDVQTPALLEKILEEGFTDPICIWRDSYGAYGVGNGHHRLTCAILLGMDEIPVLISQEPEEYYPDASEGNKVFGRDDEISNWIYNNYGKTYKKLLKEERQVELDEQEMKR